METITITLSRDLTEENWSLEINGDRYTHVSINTLDALVEQALLVAQSKLFANEVIPAMK